MPGDSTTGSTFLNDATGWLDAAVFYGTVALASALICAGIYSCARAIIRDLRNPSKS